MDIKAFKYFHEPPYIEYYIGLYCTFCIGKPRISIGQLATEN